MLNNGCCPGSQPPGCGSERSEVVMAVILTDTRHLSDDVLEALRFRALRACERGFTQADVADILGVATETVCRWWVAYSAGGLDAIPHERTGRPPGSGAAL